MSNELKRTRSPAVPVRRMKLFDKQTNPLVFEMLKN